MVSTDTPRKRIIRLGQILKNLHGEGKGFLDLVESVFSDNATDDPKGFAPAQGSGFSFE